MGNQNSPNILFLPFTLPENSEDGSASGDEDSSNDLNDLQLPAIPYFNSIILVLLLCVSALLVCACAGCIGFCCLYKKRRKALDLEEGIPHLTNVEDLQGAGETEEQQPNRAGETEPNRVGGTEPNRAGETEPNRVGETEGVEEIQLEEEPHRAGGSVPGEIVPNGIGRSGTEGTVPNGIGRSGTEGTVPNGISRSGVGGTEPNGTGGTVPNRAGGTVSNRAGKTERVEATRIVELEEEGEDSTFKEAEKVPSSDGGDGVPSEQRGAMGNSNHHVQQIPPNVNEPTVAADNIPTQDNIDPAPPGEYPSDSLPSDWNASCRIAVSPPKSQTLRKHHVTNGQKAPPIRHSSTADQETSPHKDEVFILHTANRDTVSIHHRTTDHETTMTYRHSADQTVIPKSASTDQTHRHSADQAVIPKRASTDQTHRHSADQGIIPKRASTDQTHRLSADQTVIPKRASTDQTHRHSADQAAIPKRASTDQTHRHSADQTVIPKRASTDQTHRHSADQAVIPKHASTDQTHRHSADQGIIPNHRGTHQKGSSRRHSTEDHYQSNPPDIVDTHHKSADRLQQQESAPVNHLAPTHKGDRKHHHHSVELETAPVYPQDQSTNRMRHSSGDQETVPNNRSSLAQCDTFMSLKKGQSHTQKTDETEV